MGPRVGVSRGKESTAHMRFRLWDIDRHCFKTRCAWQPRWTHQFQTNKSTLRTDLTWLGNITEPLLPPLFHLLPSLFYFRNSPHPDARHLWTSTFTTRLPSLFLSKTTTYHDHGSTSPAKEYWLQPSRTCASLT